MVARIIFPLGVCLLGAVGIAIAQSATPAGSAPATTDGWRPPSAGAAASSSAPAAPRTPIAKVTQGPGALPNDGGQEWRDYDITPYTSRVTSTNRPEQAIVDWVLRETGGYEVWHGEPLGLLSANKKILRVYHTPQIHSVVGEVVDRFVSGEAESQGFSVHVISVGNPGWRTKAHRALHPITTQSPGAQAWLMAKEDAALLMADFRRRNDFHEHSSPQLAVSNGQSTVVAASQTRNYIRDVVLKGDAWPGFEPQSAQIDEGFSLEFSPLLSLDKRTIDAVIKCHVDQVEKMVPVFIDAPTTAAPRQRTKIEVPQLSCCRMHERFRWPVDQVLVISLGVVATPVKSTSPVSLSVPLLSTPSRADLVVIVDAKGKAMTTVAAPPPPATGPVIR